MTTEFKITRKFLEGLDFHVMTASERRGFLGCEHPVPLYAETEEYMVVLDGDRCDVFLDEFGTTVTCENVRELA